jgi:hypothetical protein
MYILDLIDELIFGKGAAQLTYGRITGVFEMFYGCIADVFKKENVNLFFWIAGRVFLRQKFCQVFWVVFQKKNVNLFFGIAGRFFLRHNFALLFALLLRIGNAN